MSDQGAGVIPVTGAEFVLFQNEEGAWIGVGTTAAIAALAGAVSLDNAIIKDPATSARNVIEGDGDVTELTLRASAGQTEPMFALLNDADIGLQVIAEETGSGLEGITFYDSTSDVPADGGWIALGINHDAVSDPAGEVDLLLSYGVGSENHTEIWAGYPRGGQGGFGASTETPISSASVGASARAPMDASLGETRIHATVNFFVGSAEASLGIDDDVMAVKVRAAPAQTAPMLDARDTADGRRFSVAQPLGAQNEIVMVTAITAAIDADAGDYTLHIQPNSVGSSSLGDVVVTVGDNEATIQAAFDAIGVGEFVIGGNWSEFSIEFVGVNANLPQNPVSLATVELTANTMTLLGDPVTDPFIVVAQFGQAQSAGGFIIRFNAEPADDDLSPGDLGLWFDPTNGAAQVGYKGKTLDGTVVFAYGPMGP